MVEMDKMSTYQQIVAKRLSGGNHNYSKNGIIPFVLIYQRGNEKRRRKKGRKKEEIRIGRWNTPNSS